MQRRQEYGNSLFKNNSVGVRKNQADALYETTNLNKTRNFGVQSDYELNKNSKISPIDYNKNYNSLIFNEHRKNRENAENIFDLSNDFSDSKSFKSFNTNQRNKNYLDPEPQNLFRNYELNMANESDYDQIKSYRSQVRYNFDEMPPEPIINENYNKMNYLYDTKRNK